MIFWLINVINRKINLTLEIPTKDYLKLFLRQMRKYQVDITNCSFRNILFDSAKNVLHISI